MTRHLTAFLAAMLLCQFQASADEPGALPSDPSAASAESPQPVAGEVVRAAFTSAVVDREPVDSILTLGNGESHVYCFTELRGLAGQRVTHRWEYEGKVMAEVSFDVGGWRWRVWSRKNLRPEWHGRWRVSVVDASGRVLAQRDLAYESAQAFENPAATLTAARP